MTLLKVNETSSMSSNRNPPQNLITAPTTDSGQGPVRRSWCWGVDRLTASWPVVAQRFTQLRPLLFMDCWGLEAELSRNEVSGSALLIYGLNSQEQPNIYWTLSILDPPWRIFLELTYFIPTAHSFTSFDRWENLFLTLNVLPLKLMEEEMESWKSDSKNLELESSS